MNTSAFDISPERLSIFAAARQESRELPPDTFSLLERAYASARGLDVVLRLVRTNAIHNDDAAGPILSADDVDALLALSQHSAVALVAEIERFNDRLTDGK
ncbi:hypothetical protein ABLT15_28055 [Paraburkholderia tropica]|uniref:hypothetical protein n=1 Tax=Paraburkholderia tropica TaxID=92647 RepID=UPI0032B38EEE